MMDFGPRKLLSSRVGLHKNTRILLGKKIVDCTCYMLCPPKCDNSSEDEHRFTVPAPPPTSQKNNMPMFLIIMLCILGAAFVFLCYLTILRRYRSNLSTSRRRFASFFDGTHVFVDENHGPVLDHPIWYIRTVGLEQSVIDSIPVFKYKKGDGLVEGTDCSVCLSEFQEDESLRLLPKCSHAFHITCIDTWLGSHKNCPLCRAPIVRDVNISITTDTTLVNTGVSTLDSREHATIDDQQENDENEGRASVSRIEDEHIGPLWDEQVKILEKIRVLSDLGDHRVRVGEELQSVRRSFSMDLSSATKIYAQVAKIQREKEEGSSSVQEVEARKQNLDMVAAKLGNKNSSINRSRKSFSFGRSLQSVPIRMKRSFSSSGKLSSHRNSRSQELARTL